MHIPGSVNKDADERERAAARRMSDEIAGDLTKMLSSEKAVCEPDMIKKGPSDPN